MSLLSLPLVGRERVGGRSIKPVRGRNSAFLFSPLNHDLLIAFRGDEEYIETDWLFDIVER